MKGPDTIRHQEKYICIYLKVICTIWIWKGRSIYSNYYRIRYHGWYEQSVDIIHTWIYLKNNLEKCSDTFKLNTTKIFYRCQVKTKWNGNKLTTGSKKEDSWSTYTIFTDVWNNPFDEIGQKQFSCVFILSCKKNEAIQNDPRPSAFRKCQLPIKKDFLLQYFINLRKSYKTISLF